MNDPTYIVSEPYRCPKCGSIEVGYTEDVSQYWTIFGITSNGTVILNANSRDYGDPNGDNARFFCCNCDHSWPAIDIEHDFVWSDEVEIIEPEDDEPIDFMSDAEADADVLRSAGMGTDEDYGYTGYDE